MVITVRFPLASYHPGWRCARSSRESKHTGYEPAKIPEHRHSADLSIPGARVFGAAGGATQYGIAPEKQVDDPLPLDPRQIRAGSLARALVRRASQRSSVFPMRRWRAGVPESSSAVKRRRASSTTLCVPYRAALMRVWNTQPR